MQTRSLRTLIRIHQVGSFSQAADLQNMTLSALSMQMKALEAELGAALFDRSFRPPRLTPLGRMVAEEARSLIAAEQNLLEICGAETEVKGVFQIGLIQSATVRILPRFLGLAQAQLPRAIFKYSSGLSEGLSEAVALGQLDAAVVTRVDPQEGPLRHDLIVSEQMCYAVPKGSEDLTLHELADRMAFIHFMPSTGIGRLIATTLTEAGVTPAQTLILDSVEACIECVNSGMGFTILPRPDFDRYRSADVALSRRLPPPMQRDLVLVSRRSDAQANWRTRLHDLLCQAVAPSSGAG